MRFIAGAVCPACGSQDSMRAELSSDGEGQYRECVECGFNEKGTAEQVAAQPASRLADNTDAEGRQPIRILHDPRNHKP
ncbi:MAG: YheV family putative metal-binding protein [Natronospirillum sp.]|uniref:YheV family putative zinc ribbon protein n=1 Tax=Natronospirillum sp. TaxID=2812955 RepID=UPI0025E00070|nr:YheV family putative zinc ribbon protein [Natronospirillum sp.]MCH8552200.1 YheV family putative metal-binding protein [Natronospirillum sp.]